MPSCTIDHIPTTPSRQHASEALRRRASGALTTVTALLLAGQMLVNCAATPSTGPIDVAASLKALDSLPVKGRATKTGYSRNQFGASWQDTDRNGCDTRNDILARDLSSVQTDSRCRVTRGQLLDPYTGRAISFTRGELTSPEVQIDHVVALSNAWQTGAQKLTTNTRISFANDPDNLIAVDGPTNAAKGDADAATWLPPRKQGRCAYVARQIRVKEKYNLWLTAAEKTAMQRVLGACPKAS